MRELSDKLREGRLRCYGHVRRRENNYVGNRVMRMNTGRRKREKPKRRWMDCVEEDMRAANVSGEDAEDRCKWRRKICTGDPT